MGCKKFIIFLAVTIISITVRCQPTIQLTQYFVVPAYFNPASQGNTDFLDIKGAMHLQWTGITGAPKSYLLTGGLPIMIGEKNRIGTGVVVSQESAGLYRTLGISAQLSYKIPIFGGFLSAGLQPGYISQTFKGSEIYIPEDDEGTMVPDEDLPITDLNGSSFDLGAGIWYSNEKIWTGFSVQHLTSPTIRFKDTNHQGESGTTLFEFKEKPVFYLMAGCNIPIKNTLFDIRPSFLLTHVGNFNAAEASVMVGWRKMFSAGISYSWENAIGFILSAEIKGFFLGYSYDYPTGIIASASKGSHEITAGYRVKLELQKPIRHKYKSIRLM